MDFFNNIGSTLLACKRIFETRLWVTLTHTAVEMMSTVDYYEAALVSGVSWTVKVIKSRGLDNAHRRAANCLGYTDWQTVLLLLSRASNVAGCTWVST